MKLKSPMFQGKVVLITGAGGGIGRAHALAFAREGAKVVVNDVGGTREGSGGGSAMADAVVKEIQAQGGEAVAHYESIATYEGAQSLLETALKAFGRADVLINNAGILRDKTLLKMEESWWDAVIAVHLKGTFACSQVFARHVVEAGHPGRIINTTSYAGLMGNFGQSNYAAAKAGIYGFTLTIALELRSKGITVNAVAPMAKTRMTTDIDVIPEEMVPEQISPLVLFLASDEAEDITGKVFGVHGQQIFPYVMKMYDGVTKAGKEFWTPQEIADRLDEITAEGPPEPAATASAPAEAGDPVSEAFAHIPLGFVPEKAVGKKFNIFFDIKDGPAQSLILEDGKLRVAKGKVGTPSCTVTSDSNTIVAIFTGKMKAEAAFMQGKIKATNLGDMMTLGQVVSAKKAMEAIQKQAGAGARPSAADPVSEAFSHIPLGFLPEKASGKKFNIFFDIKNGPAHSLILKDGTLTVEKGKVGTPTCTVTTDADTAVGIFTGKIKAEAAFMQGKIKATNIGDMMTLGQVLSAKKAMEALKSGAASSAAGTAPAGDPVSAAFANVPAGFVAEKASGKKFNIFFDIKDGPAHSLILKDGALRVEKGKVGTPTCTVTTDANTVVGIFTGKIKAEAAFMQGKIKATNIGDMMTLGQVVSAKKAMEVLSKGENAGGASATAPGTDPVAAAFAALPNAFKKDKAGDWKAVIHFKIDGSADRTLSVAAGEVKSSEGLQGEPDCVITTDAETIAGLLAGKVDGQKAFMQGKIKANNIGVLMKFSQYFDFKAASAAPSAASASAPSVEAAPDLTSFIGRKYDGGFGFAEPKDMIAYARAVDADLPIYVDESREGGIVAHPLFAVRAFHETLVKAASDPDLGLDLARLVHGEQDMRFHRIIRPMDLLQVRGAIHDIRTMEKGTTVTVRLYAYIDGRVAVEAFSNLFIRARAKDRREKAAAGGKKGTGEAVSIPESARGDAPIVVKSSMTIDKDLPARYAEASLDRNPIHLDENIARSAGLPGVILHGLCTMALSANPLIASLCDGDPARLKRLAVRFSKPVLPGDTLTLEAWKGESHDGRNTYNFEVLNQSDVPVITRGVAEIE